MSETLSFNLIGDVSASEWDAMTQEEQEAVIESRFDGLVPSQIGEIRDTILRTLEQYKEVIKEYRDDLRIEARGRRGAEEHAAEAQELLREIDDLKLTLTDFEGDIQLVAADEITQFQTHHRDHSGDDEFAVSQYEMGGPGDDPEENTYTFTLRPRGILLEGETGPRSDEEYLREEEIVDEKGEVINDINLDGIYNHSDIEEALRQKNDPLMRQKVFFLLKPDHTLTLERYNPEAGEVVFKVTDPEGNFAYFEFENLSPETVFSFSSGVTEADFRSWPEPFLKQSRLTQPDGSPSEKTVYDILFPTEIPEEDRLRVIPGYRESLEQLSRIALGLDVLDPFSDISLNVSGPSEPSRMLPAAEKILRTLFGFLDQGDPSLEGLRDLWRKIEEDLRSFSEQDRSKILQAVVLALAKVDPELFARLCGPVVSLLEGVLEKETIDGSTEPSAGAKLVILLLETKAGAGKYGGEAIWQQLFPDPALGTPETGTWQGESSRASSLEAIRNYETIVTNYMDGDVGSRFNLIVTYLETGEDPLAAEDMAKDPSVGEENGEVKITLTSDVYNDAVNYDDWYIEEYDLDEDTLGVFENLIRDLYGSGSISVSQARQKIKSAVETVTDSYLRSCLASLIIVFFHNMEETYNLHLFDALTAGEGGSAWVQSMRGYLDTSGVDERPPLYDEAWGYLIEATRG